MIPLLQNTRDNSHATLITLFMNTIDETLTQQDSMRHMQNSSSTKRLLSYLPPDGARLSKYDPRLIKFSLGRDIVINYDDIFERYAIRLNYCRFKNMKYHLLNSNN